MSTFVLVHGAWQSNGTWDLLTPLLQKHGHRVIAPVLSGLGTDQSRLSSDITLQQHVEDVSRELARLPDRVILVGHSYAGMIISGAAEANPTQVRQLVFLDAFIPENGQSVQDLLPPEIGAIFATSRGPTEMDGGYRAGRANLTSGDSNLARRAISSAPGCVILASAALRNRFLFPPIGSPAFQPPSLAVWRKDIRRGHSSSHLPGKPALQAGWSPNWRLAMTAMSNFPARSRTSCYRPRSRNEVQPPADRHAFTSFCPPDIMDV